MLLLKAEFEREPWLNCTCSHLHQCHNVFFSVKSEMLEGQYMQYYKIQTLHRPLDTVSSVSLSTYSIRIVHLSVATLLLTTNRKHFVLGSPCGNKKEILHAVYITIICLLLISNLILIFVVCRMCNRSGNWVFILKAFFLFLILY